MAHDANGVNIRQNENVPDSKIRRPRYHHGDLANALTGAATELARSGGPEAVVLREAARKVGVSATAAYRHFEGRGELIHAVKELALVELAARMQDELTASEPVPDPPAEALRRLRALGSGYIRFALAEPGLFRTAFCRSDMPGMESKPMDMLGTRSFQMLVETLDTLVGCGWIPPDRRPYLELAAWSTVHGVAELLLDGPLRLLPPDQQEAAIQRTLDLVTDGIAALAGRAAGPAGQLSADRS
jgi:AcrR family transcriptional regulator